MPAIQQSADQLPGKQRPYYPQTRRYHWTMRYFMHAENIKAGETAPKNRRRFPRINIEKRSDCAISLTEGIYPCIIRDISETGMGLDMNIEYSKENFIGKTFFTHFEDKISDKEFFIIGQCLHVTELSAGKIRCGCKILNATPPINEYIKRRQSACAQEAESTNGVIMFPESAS